MALHIVQPESKYVSVCVSVLCFLMVWKVIIFLSLYWLKELTSRFNLLCSCLALCSCVALSNPVLYTNIDFRGQHIDVQYRPIDLLQIAHLSLFIAFFSGQEMIPCPWFINWMTAVASMVGKSVNSRAVTSIDIERDTSPPPSKQIWPNWPRLYLIFLMLLCRTPLHMLFGWQESRKKNLGWSSSAV